MRLSGREIPLLFVATFLLLSSPAALAQSDAAKFAEGRVAFDKYKDCPAAVKALESVSEEGRKNPLWVFYFAKVQECLGNLEAALLFYEKYDALVPGQTEVIDKIGDLRYRRRYAEEKAPVLELYRKAEEFQKQNRFLDAEIEYRKTLKIRPKDLDVRLSFAWFLEGLGKLSEAQREYNFILRNIPKDTTVSDLQKGTRALAEGGVKTELLLWNLNEDLFEEAPPDSDPELPHDYFWYVERGISFLDKGNSNRDYYHFARLEFEVAIKIMQPNNPDYPVVHVGLARAYYGLSFYEDAERATRKAIQLRPENPNAHSLLALTLEAVHKFAEAEAELREAIRLNPTNAQFQERLNRLMDKRKKEKK